MAQQLTKLIERVKTWPAWRQHDVARMIEAMEESAERQTRAVTTGARTTG
jgi:hypothetical protein